MLPMFVSFGSHDFKHAIHVIYEAHYSQKTHDHTAHNHSEPETQPQHHPIDASLLSYIKDYLYAVRQFNSHEKNKVVKKAEKQLVDNYVALRDESCIKDMLPVKQMEPGILSRNDLYLKTQRLRIDV